MKTTQWRIHAFVVRAGSREIMKGKIFTPLRQRQMFFLRRLQINVPEKFLIKKQNIPL
jgi:hypothetical protein